MAHFQRTRTGIFPIVLLFMILVAACTRGQQSPSAGSHTSSPSSSLKSGKKIGTRFEGLIELKIDTPDRKNLRLTYFIKGDYSRIESQFERNSDVRSILLWDAATHKLTTLMPKKKRYMTLELNKYRELSNETGSKEEKPGNQLPEPQFPKLIATGTKEIIAGYPCEDWVMGEGRETTMCVAKGLGYFGMGSKLGGLGTLKNFLFSPNSLTSNATPTVWVGFLEGGAFPLKATQTDNGQIKMALEATRIESQKLDALLFTIPPGYTELKMPKTFTH